MKIYIIRHGQTDWNKDKITQGKTNIPLNITGLKQAKQISKFLNERQIDIIYASPLARAYTTAVLATNRYDIEILDLLAERDFGPFEGKHVNEYYDTKHPCDYHGYESNTEIQRRVKSALEKIVTENNADSIALFAHNHILKSALILTDSNKYSYDTKIKNCAIGEFHYDKESNKLSLIAIHQ